MLNKNCWWWLSFGSHLVYFQKNTREFYIGFKPNCGKIVKKVHNMIYFTTYIIITYIFKIYILSPIKSFIRILHLNTCIFASEIHMYLSTCESQLYLYVSRIPYIREAKVVHDCKSSWIQSIWNKYTYVWPNVSRWCNLRHQNLIRIHNITN